MSSGPLAAVLGRVHGLFGSWNAEDLTDGQLLDAYVARHDPGAFAVLLRRHGGLVLNVCRGVLHNEHDAEDAFQASFLILARKASSIRRLASVGGWLYQVAYTVSLKARAARRPVPARPARDVAAGDPAASLARQELCAALDEEMQRLPEKYRLPLVLCYLENLTTGETARRLRWPAGTVKVRLMQGRELLRKRLSRRGFSLATAGVASLLMLRAASAAAPSALAKSTLHAAALVRTNVAAAVAGLPESAARLVESSLLAMRATRLKGLLTALVVAVLVAAGAGGLALQAEFANGAMPQTAEQFSRPAAGLQTGPSAMLQDEPPAFDPSADAPLAAAVRLRQDQPVVAVAVSLHNKMLAAAGTDGRLQVWDVPSRQPLARLPDDDLPAARTRPRFMFAGLCFPDNRSVAAGGHGYAGKTAVVVWEADTGRQLRSMPADNCFTFLPGGEHAAADRGHSVVVWDLFGRERLLADVSTSKIRTVALGAGGKTVALANDERTVQLHDATSGQLLHRFRPEWDAPIPGPRDSLVLSADGSLVAVGGSWDGNVPVWHVRTGRLVRTLAVSSGLVHNVVFSPDGTKVVAAARDESIRIFDVATGSLLHMVSRPHGEAGITTLGFAPDGKTIVSGATDGTICCWPLP
jgi:RNA polymerase sigma factor (sigma-70 family)